MLVCADISKSWTNPFNGRKSAEMDASIVATHMMLAAKDTGIDSCWVCYFDTEKVKEVFKLPENIEPYLLMPMGYPADGAGPSPRHQERKPIVETVKYL